jgi:hypothetical protein
MLRFRKQTSVDEDQDMPPSKNQDVLPLLPSLDLENQLQKQRRTVDFDSFDMTIKELIQRMKDREIHISPRYQRRFRWEEDRCSLFVESMLLGIPIPSVFMATNPDSTWELVDGVQRLSTLAYFAGNDELRAMLNVADIERYRRPLALEGLKKLSKFNGFHFLQLPEASQRHFLSRPLKVITLNDKSDRVLRFDLFERLNTGGVILSKQEIRDCIFEGQFADKIEELSKDPNFKKVVTLTKLQRTDATAEECVLRFFAFRARYTAFVHDVTDFLNDYMEWAVGSFNYEAEERVFRSTFSELARIFPDGLKRVGTKRGSNTTPLNLFEGIAVGASFALERVTRLHTAGMKSWLASDTLRRFTTGATNSGPAVKGRIEFCRNRFIGKPYVPDSKD